MSFMFLQLQKHSSLTVPTICSSTGKEVVFTSSLSQKHCNVSLPLKGLSGPLGFTSIFCFVISSSHVPQPRPSAKWCRHSHCTGGEMGTVSLGTTQPNNLVVKSYAEVSGHRFENRSIFRNPPLSGSLCHCSHMVPMCTSDHHFRPS